MSEAVQKCSECKQWKKIEAGKGKNFVTVATKRVKHKGHIIVKNITRLLCTKCKKDLEE